MIKVNYERVDILNALKAIDRLKANKAEYLCGFMPSSFGLCHEIGMIHLNNSCMVQLSEVAHLDKRFVPHPWHRDQVGVGKAILAKFKHEHKIKGTSILYPVGGKEQFFAEEKAGTLLQNKHRWALLDFIEAQLKYIIEHGTLGF